MPDNPAIPFRNEIKKVPMFFHVFKEVWITLDVIFKLYIVDK